MYDRTTDFWQMLFHICNGLTIRSKHFWSQFFGAQMRFYKNMLMASKVTIAGVREHVCALCEGTAFDR